MKTAILILLAAFIIVTVHDVLFWVDFYNL